ncbi:hypothetical protein LYSHEL_16790 [Lysobacter helvus]|uniref:JAB domain-containing protein n=2 Tax=Lysobacteraceae TaxID=32033 RepID=A0ABM7Q5X2_9GAMM|nr:MULTISPECIES: Mov34/MPN/PAD-1 family protein [Lysobacter]BCT92655.1 hypothetical protein LYSCAS_16790 [Lysobacter caseinilyticus]BCT95808.1 hypothetical protein LYSHEL_16790 [Lysobacter helvus]
MTLDSHRRRRRRRTRALLCAIAALPATHPNACDLHQPRFSPEHATPETARTDRTRIPRDIRIEQGGFATADAAAACFGARYHDDKRAEFVTFLVHTEDGWAYLTPGKGPRNARRVHTEALHRASNDAGHALLAVAHTHPFGMPYFSATDAATVLRANGPMYLTNWRNETWRLAPEDVRSQLERRGFPSTTISVSRLFSAPGMREGWRGTPVAPVVNPVRRADR